MQAKWIKLDLIQIVEIPNFNVIQQESDASIRILKTTIPCFSTSSTTFDKTFFYFKAVGQSFSKARVLVESGLDSYLEPVFTLQPGFCGQEGDYIHLTPDYIKSFRKLPFPFQEKGETKNLQISLHVQHEESFLFNSCYYWIFTIPRMITFIADIQKLKFTKFNSTN